MGNETSVGPAGAPNSGGHSQGSGLESAPLQSRAKFLQNWSWSSVTQINGGLCERGRAQRGPNPEAHAAVAEEWEKRQTSELTLLETFQFLKSRAPLCASGGFLPLGYFLDGLRERRNWRSCAA